MTCLSKLYFLVGCIATSSAFFKAYELVKEFQYLIWAVASLLIFFSKISLFMSSKLLKPHSVAVSRPGAFLSYTLSCFLNLEYLKISKKAQDLNVWSVRMQGFFIKCSI